MLTEAANVTTASPVASTRIKRFLEGLDVARLQGIEIGALASPLVRRHEGAVIYVDYLDTATLREKYRDDPNVDENAIVDVDAVWGIKSLSEAIDHRKVDYVLASHVVEHVPDLITWLSQLTQVLRPDGEIRLLIPDRRFTFDYLRQPTRLCDVLPAYLTCSVTPTASSVIDFMLNATHIDCVEAWTSRIDPASLVSRWCTRAAAFAAMKQCIEEKSYIDVHCWVFTPKSFALLMADLTEAGFISLACEAFRDTARCEVDFSVTMRPTSDTEGALQSWKRMASLAQDLVFRESMADIPHDFDPDFYLEANPDVAAAGLDAREHYAQFGWKEQRPLRPNRTVKISELLASDMANALPIDFAPQEYFSLHADVRAAQHGCSGPLLELRARRKAPIPSPDGAGGSLGTSARSGKHRL